MICYFIVYLNCELELNAWANSLNDFGCCGAQTAFQSILNIWFNKASQEPWYSVPGWTRVCYYGYGQCARACPTMSKEEGKLNIRDNKKKCWMIVEAKFKRFETHSTSIQLRFNMFQHG